MNKRSVAHIICVVYALVLSIIGCGAASLLANTNNPLILYFGSTIVAGIIISSMMIAYFPVLFELKASSLEKINGSGWLYLTGITMPFAIISLWTTMQVFQHFCPLVTPILISHL